MECGQGQRARASCPQSLMKAGGVGNGLLGSHCSASDSINMPPPSLLLLWQTIRYTLCTSVQLCYLRNTSALLRISVLGQVQRLSKRSSASTCPLPTLDLVSFSKPLGFISECEYLVDRGAELWLQHSSFIRSIQPTLDSDSLPGKYS